MNKANLTINSIFQSDTVYTVSEKHLYITVKDTCCLKDNIYLSLSEFHYGYLNTAFYLKGLKNVVLDFGGAVLTLHGRIQPFVIDECENIIIRNVTVEYERSLYTELTIIKNENNSLHLRQMSKFPCRVENGYLIPYSSIWENQMLNYGDMWIQTFDTKTGEGTGGIVGVIGEEVFLHDTPPCEVTHLKVREENGEIILSGKIPSYWDDTMTVVLAHEFRDISSVFLCRSKDISISDYRILNGAGMGILGMYTKNISVDHLIMTKDELSHGIITNIADAVHLIACSGEVVLRNSIIEGMVDDSLNIHSNYLEITEVSTHRMTVMRHKESHMTNAHYQLFGEGDMVAIHNGTSMIEKQTFVIRSVQVLDDYHLEITTDSVLDKAKVHDHIENLSTQPDLLIENCIFGKANSHLRLQTRGKILISGCTTSLPVLLTGDTDYWRESSPVQDLTISNCRFVGIKAIINSTPVFKITENEPYYHKNVKILNNSFDAVNAFEAYATDCMVFHNNTHTGNQPLTINLRKCGSIDADENCILIKNEIE